WLPRTLERFAREELRLTGLPCVLDREDWAAVFTRTALRYLVHKPPGGKQAAGEFYERLLKRGTETWQQAVQAENPARSLEEQRRLAIETGVSEPEVRQFVAAGRKCQQAIEACCLSPTGKR